MRIHRSNRADVLARALADVLRAPTGGPLEPERVVVSGRAAERLVSAHIAQTVGVAANVRALSPSTWAAETIAALRADEDAPPADAWTRDRLLWAVLRLLPSLAADPAFAPIRFYLGADAGAGSARAVGLARRIAETFERYAASRPDMVQAWEAGSDDVADRHGLDWQPVLWRALGPALGGASPAAATHDAVARIRAGTVPAERLPSRVTWLTHGSIARLHLDLLAALDARDVPIELFVLSPSRGAARAARALAADLGADVHPPAPGPLRLGHPLVESLGRQGRDFEMLLVAVGLAADDGVEEYVEPAGDSALAAIQRDLLKCTEPNETKSERPPYPAGDRSIRVHACHGALRQVEVLRDEILRCLDEMPGLEPRDVLVLTPNLEAFAPLVEAVFAASASSGDGAPPRVPVRIADRPVRRENPVADTVLRALGLVGGRFGATDVLELLAQPHVARRFGLHELERDTLRRWVHESGIRWGIDAEHRGEQHVPPLDQNSWRFGFDRLLVGQAMAGDGRALFAGVLPYDEIEGREAEQLGRVVEACERLFARARELQRPRPMGDWRGALAALADELLGDDDDALAWPLHVFRAALDTMASDADAAGHDAPLDLAAVRALLETHFGEPGASAGFASGAVTVCALLPGRTVPARVVALLGLDDGVFPRRRGGVGYDLAAREPRLGDADANADDRQRFLEAIAGAGERLIITHTGRSTSTNAAIAPAVPVGELLDTLDETFAAPAADGPRGSVRACVVRDHTLQPFAAVNFRAAEDGESPSYDRTWLAAAARAEQPRRAPHPFVAAGLPDTDDTPTISVAELASFFSAPAQWTLRHRLRVSLGATELDLPPREPCELDRLQQYEVRRDLLDRTIAGDEISAALPFVRASGRLPHGAVGDVAFDAILGETVQLRDALFDAQTSEPLDDVMVDVTAAGVRLVGTVRDVYEHGRLCCQAGRAHDKHLVSLWVQHLALAVARPDAGLTSSLVALPPGGNATKCVTVLQPVDNAMISLALLLELWREAQAVPLPFFPTTSRAYAKEWRKATGAADAYDRAAEAARKKWLRSGPFATGQFEGEDAYVQRLFGDAEPFADPAGRDARFHRSALGVWDALEAALGDARGPGRGA